MTHVYFVLQDGVITETIIEMNTLAECLVHMVVDVDEVEVLITTEDTAPIMKGRTRVMGQPDGVLLQRTVMMV